MDISLYKIKMFLKKAKVIFFFSEKDVFFYGLAISVTKTIFFPLNAEKNIKNSFL